VLIAERRRTEQHEATTDHRRLLAGLPAVVVFFIQKCSDSAFSVVSGSKAAVYATVVDFLKKKYKTICIKILNEVKYYLCIIYLSNKFCVTFTNVFLFCKYSYSNPV